MFERIINFISDAITRLSCGASFEEALEQAVTGEVASEYAIQTEKPIIQHKDFYELLKSIGLDLLGDSIVPGEANNITLGELDSLQKITLSAQAHKSRPHAEIAIEGRIMEARIVIRQNSDTNMYQIDDAYIGDIVNGFVEPNWLITTDKHDIAPDIIHKFLPIFSSFAKEIYEAPEDQNPTDIEVRLGKALKPLQDEIATYEEQRYLEYRSEIAKMGKEDPLAPR